MGEIGIQRREFLYEIDFWEARRLIRGYHNRHRSMWSAVRWQTFHIMLCNADLKKAGITCPMDLMTFPWEKADSEDSNIDILSDEEIAKMQELMRQENARREAEQAKNK